MKKDYLGECEKDGVSYAVLIIAENKEEAIETYEHYMNSHKDLIMPLDYKEKVAELWFMNDEDIPEEAIREIKQYNCAIL